MKHNPWIGFSMLLLSASVFVHTLGSAQAIPSMQNIGYGSNPLFTVGGTISNSSSTVMTAPSDQMMVVSDVILTMNPNLCASLIEFTDSSGNALGHFKLHSNLHYDGDKAAQSQPSSVQHAFNSGIALSPNNSLTISETGNCSVAYTLSGYYAQP